MDNFTKVQKLIAEALQVPLDKIQTNTAFGNIPEWDSMGHMQIMFLLESELKLDITAEMVSSLSSVEAITNALDVSKKE